MNVASAPQSHEFVKQRRVLQIAIHDHHRVRMRHPLRR
jgi:hypothetical protein